MPKERRASHEEDRERRQTDVSHCVVAVTPRAFALVGQTGADLAQRPDHLCNGAHPALESMIEPAHKRKPLHAVGTNQEPTTCGISDSGHRTKGQRTRLNRIENRWTGSCGPCAPQCHDVRRGGPCSSIRCVGWWSTSSSGSSSSNSRFVCT